MTKKTMIDKMIKNQVQLKDMCRIAISYDNSKWIKSSGIMADVKIGADLYKMGMNALEMLYKLCQADLRKVKKSDIVMAYLDFNNILMDLVRFIDEIVVPQKIEELKANNSSTSESKSMITLKKITLKQYKEFLAYGFYKLGNPRITIDRAADLVASKNFDMATISKNDLYYADVRTTKCLHINATDSDRDQTTEHFASGEKYYTLEHNDVLYLLHDYQWDSGNISFKVVRR